MLVITHSKLKCILKSVDTSMNATSKKKTEKKCIIDISSEYQKRLKKYRELKTLMSESSRYN